MKLTATVFFLLLSLNLSAQHTSLPYYDDFETGAPGWVSWYDVPCGTEWELGEPSTGFTIGGYSGTHCWDINLNSFYQNSATCFLSSPVFDFTSVPVAKVSFYTKYHTEYLWDYMMVQYTVNNGDTWSYLPFPNLLNPDGYLTKWTESSITTPDFYGYPSVQFRFIFVSDNTVAYDGFSVDDFRIDIDELGTPEVAGTSAFSVYPNPSRGNIHFNFNKTLNPSDQLIIYSSEGKEVVHQQASLENELLLPNGIYSAVFESGDHLAVQKLVVLK